MKKRFSSRRRVELTKFDTNAVYDIINEFKLLLLRYEDNRLIVSKIRSIFRSKAVTEVFIYFCRHGAASAWVIQCRLTMPEPTVYRALRTLRSQGFLVPALKVSSGKRSKRGRDPVIWVIEGATPKNVTEALSVHNKMLSSKFRMAEKIAKDILDEYKEAGKVLELNYSDIVRIMKVKRLKLRGRDVQEVFARYLIQNGMKVWR